MRTPLFALTLCLVPGLSPGQIGASTVISYTVGTGVSSLYTDPNQALGRPTVDTVLEMDLVPVAPVYAPWLPDELVSVGAGGELILGFDRAIEDDPDNPYGVDLLVFGNSFLSTLSGNDYANHPESTVVGSGLFPEPGRVSVSQDGSNWLAFTSGPFADGMLPTLGRVWTGSAWGGETDPTLPPDPALAPAMLSGMTVAELALRYRGGAGGTGFNLGELALPVDPETGLKWCRYVRIQCDALSTEIDAVTDVRPVNSRLRWEQKHFPWTGDPALEKTFPRVTWSPDGGLDLWLPATASAEDWRIRFSDTPELVNWQGAQALTGEVDEVNGTLLRRHVPLPAAGAYGLFHLELQGVP